MNQNVVSISPNKYTDKNHLTMISLKPLMVTILVGLMNSLFCTNYTVMLLLAAVEVLLLCYYFVRNKDIEYMCMYLVFLCFSMENASFVGTDAFYGFKNFKLMGINIAIWCLIPIFIKYLFLLVWKDKKMEVPRQEQNFLKWVFIITILGISIGFMTYLLNDNGLGTRPGAFGKFFDACYIYVFVLMEVFTFSSILSTHRNRINKVKQYLTCSVPALAVVFLMCLFLENYGNRGGLKSLQVSNVYMLLVCAFLISLYDCFNKKERIVLMVSGLIIAGLTLRYNASGKNIIVVMLIPFLIFFILKRQGVNIKRLFVIFGVILLAIVFIVIVLPNMVENSFLLSEKLKQVMSLVSFWKSGWLQNMSESPKIRITEFLNIGYELINKPWFLPLGKGFMGSIKDNLSLFDTLTIFAFSEWELSAEAYYLMHETVNSLFLTSGIMGLVFVFKTFVYMFKNYHRSPWLIIGAMWFILFYSYSITISVYGVIALMVGYFDCEEVKTPFNR